MHPIALARCTGKDAKYLYQSALFVAWMLIAGALLAGTYPCHWRSMQARRRRASSARIYYCRSGPRPLTLLYPKWLPGEHSPDGPIGALSGLKFVANGRTAQVAPGFQTTCLNTFHLTIPGGATSLDVTLEVLGVRDATNQNADRTTTESLAIILWNQLLLYPAGVAVG